MSTRTRTAIPEHIMRGIDRLDPLPATAQQVVAMVHGDDMSIGRLAQLIEHDETIAAGVLRLGRSAAFAGRHAPETIQDALMRIGTVHLLTLVLGDYMRRLRAAAPVYGLSEDDLWAHAAASQLAVRAIAEERGADVVPRIAETAALLHDIGKLVMTRTLKTTPDAIRAHAQAKGLTFVAAERDLFGVDHADVGGAIAEAWKFPPLVAEAIARHHDDRPPAGPVFDAVAIANVVAKSIGAGLGDEGMNFSFDAASAARLGLDFPALARICLRTEEELRELRRVAA